MRLWAYFKDRFTDNRSNATIATACLGLLAAVNPRLTHESSYLLIINPAAFLLFLILLTACADAVLYRRKRLFFGIKTGRGLLIVVPTFRWRAPEKSSDQYPSTIYKLSNLVESPDIPSPGPLLCTREDAQLQENFASGVGASAIQPEFIDDESVIRLGRIAASDALKGRTLLAFGSSQYNDLTKLALAQIRTKDGNAAFSFEGDYVLRVSPSLGLPVAPIVTTRLERGGRTGLDYGVLARVKVPTPFQEPVTVFVCAGVENVASYVLASILTEQWRHLSKAVEDNDFVALYRVNVQDKDNYSRLSPFTHLQGGQFIFRGTDGCFAAGANPT